LEFCHILAQCDILKEMATRTTVNISLTPELGAFLQSRVKSGRYQTTSEVVREALRLLQQQEKEREQRLRQLKVKLKRGASQAERGELLDGDEVFEELRQMIDERRRAKKRVTKV
jgi:antitoxin ParD1/3/4